MSPFFILFALVTASALAIVESAGSGISGDIEAIAKNGTDAWSGFGEDIRDNRLAIMSVRGDAGDKGTGNKTDAESTLKGDAKDNRLVIVDNGLVIGDDGLSVDNDRSATKIGKKTDVDNGLDA